MREIKFRAWDSYNKRMLPWRYPVDCWLRWIDGQDPEVQIMQYTGLKDKNGKEIYEGDIVKTPSGGGWVEYFDKECRYEIVQNIPGYEVPQYLSELSWRQQPEVIGNIYENPELL